MHMEKPPGAECKIVRCVLGRIPYVIVDARPESPSYPRSFSMEPTAENRRALFVPDHCAHGFQTLCDDAENLYIMTDFYRPKLQTGLRFDDPVLAIEWPLPVTTVSAQDRSWPLLAEGAGAAVASTPPLGGTAPGMPHGD